MATTRMRFVPAAALLMLAACGGGGGGGPGGAPPGPAPAARAPDPVRPPSDFLRTPRFTTHQPGVLEQIGAHHAYARGLTGAGVRIGIEDTIVDFTQRGEFGNRVRLREADGAELSYLRPYGDSAFGEVQSCIRSGACNVWNGNSAGDPEAPNRWVRQIVDRDGWPTRDDGTFMVDEHHGRGNFLERMLRWREVPTPYGVTGRHGTIVASVAAGANLGVATGAAIVPIAWNLTDDQANSAYADAVWRSAIAELPRPDREQTDLSLAASYREHYAKLDIINRSYGVDLFDPDIISAEVESELRWYRTWLPRTIDAVLQVDTPADRRTILVYSAGNEGQRWSGIGADLPYYIQELRGHSLSVVATDPETGRLAGYSNACGPVPPDWNAARHGRHYCLAAPGTVRGLVPDPGAPGRGAVRRGLTGTSFAAPLVSGALALLKEHFRGTRGNTAIVKRMIDTADRTGPYADLEIYGAGHLDLEAALAPAGALTVGPSAHALDRSSLRAPAAFGAIARRAAHLELAAFDDHGFPFWIPLPSLLAPPATGRLPIPRFEGAAPPSAPAPGLADLNLTWMAAGRDRAGARSGRADGWVAGFGPAAAGVARRARNDGWGYGLSFEDGGHLGTEASGAFRTDLESGLVWTSRSFAHAFASGLTVEAAGTLAVSLPRSGADALFRAGPSVLSAAALRIGTRTTGVVVEQPFHAESGTGAFRLENGRLEGQRKLRDEYRISLRPEARELRITVRHDWSAFGGTFAVEAGGAVHAGHVPGEREASAGLAYRRTW